MTSIGVPLMTPVKGSNDNPGLRPGVIDHDTTGPPRLLGLSGNSLLVVSLVRSMLARLYDISGTMSRIVMLTS